jgi:hypothetical protein
MACAGVVPLLVVLTALACMPASAVPAGPDGVRRCGARIETPGPTVIRPRHDIRVGPVVWFALRHPERQIVASPGPDLLAKVAIAVRAGKPALIRIPRSARRDIALTYAADADGNTPSVRRVADGQVLVRVEPCPPGTRRFSDGGRVGPWTTFSGGFVLRRRGCYPLEVARVGGRYLRKRVSFGKRCRSPQSARF